MVLGSGWVAEEWRRVWGLCDSRGAGTGVDGALDDGLVEMVSEQLATPGSM